MLVLGYARSSFRDSESHLTSVVGLDEDDVQLMLNQKNLNFITNEISSGMYLYKDTSEAVYTMEKHEKTVQIEYNDISKETKPF